MLTTSIFSAARQRTASFSSIELENLGLSSFRGLEIISFMMSAIDIIGDGFDSIIHKIPAGDKTLVMECASFLGCLDKACRHAAMESLSILSNVVLKQRSVLASCLSGMVPKTIKTELAQAPLSQFMVIPKEVVRVAKQNFDSHIQSKALIAAAYAVTSRAKAWRSSSRRFGPSSYRGGRGGFPVGRGSDLDRFGRGTKKFSWPRKRGFSRSNRSKDRFGRGNRRFGVFSKVERSAGPSSEGQL